jgi:hypothetical protein
MKDEGCCALLVLDPRSSLLKAGGQELGIDALFCTLTVSAKMGELQIAVTAR